MPLVAAGLTVAVSVIAVPYVVDADELVKVVVVAVVEVVVVEVLPLLPPQPENTKGTLNPKTRSRTPPALERSVEQNKISTDLRTDTSTQRTAECQTCPFHLGFTRHTNPYNASVAPGSGAGEYLGIFC